MPPLTVHPADLALSPAPIPADWIVEGAPIARNRVLSHASDKTGWTMLWDCSAGCFDWFYRVDETVHVLEGAVVIEQDGVTVTLKPGDSLFFAAGSRARWRVDHHVRKIAFCHHPLPAMLALPLRGMRRLKQQIAKGMALVRRSLAQPVPEMQDGADLKPAPVRRRAI